VSLLHLSSAIAGWLSSLVPGNHLCILRSCNLAISILLFWAQCIVFIEYALTDTLSLYMSIAWFFLAVAEALTMLARRLNGQLEVAMTIIALRMFRKGMEYWGGIRGNIPWQWTNQIAGFWVSILIFLQTPHNPAVHMRAGGYNYAYRNKFLLSIYGVLISACPVLHCQVGLLTTRTWSKCGLRPMQLEMVWCNVTGYHNYFFEGFLSLS
jgi:hypothetical protein